jgi:NAD(P)-dependent dehydrogenase (short-subunit alcohol dehydrogenase family)
VHAVSSYLISGLIILIAKYYYVPMNLHLTDKHILITGGSKGIGLACALGFLDEGARVTLVSRSADNLALGRQTLLAAHPDAGARIATIAADLTDPASALKALDQAEADSGAVDVLVNSAGAAKRTPPDELTPQAWHDAMQAKYFSYIYMIDPVVQRMARRGAGVIVNIVGNGGKVASPTHLAGGAANAALMLVSAGLAAAFGPKGVRVNAINPGLTLTERLKEGLKADARVQQIPMEEALSAANQRQPLRRLAEPREIADAVLFLASDRASYITGAILAMDGALTPMI